MSPQFYTIIRKILAWVGMLFAVAILQTTVFVRIAPWRVSRPDAARCARYRDF